MTRCARSRRVFYVEEPILLPEIRPRLYIERSDDVTIAVPHLPGGSSAPETCAIQRELIDQLLYAAGLSEFVLWYYTPMARPFTDHLVARAIVYDCMDELAAFKGAPSALRSREAELMRCADLVLTGGHSLYEAKRHQHRNIHAFPSSVDAAHFARARRIADDPVDQARIGHPRLGFFGVIDERMDLGLVDGVAAARPDWQLVMIGPFAKIDAGSLPQRPNIHYLGAKSYDELPHYIAGWDVALLPFARNDATRFISPTKTPEYMAAGKPVVSTSIRDVVRPYGEQRLVRIADEVPAFVQACAAALVEDPVSRLARADAFLRHMSWDTTWNRISKLVDQVVHDAGPDDVQPSMGDLTAG